MDNKNIIYCKNHIQQKTQISHICLKQDCTSSSILLCNLCIEQNFHNHQMNNQNELVYTNAYSNYVFPLQLLNKPIGTKKSKQDNNISNNNIGEDSSTSDTKTHYESNINIGCAGSNIDIQNLEKYEKEIDNILFNPCTHQVNDYCLKSIWKEKKKLSQIYQLIATFKCSQTPELQQIDKLETKIRNKLQKISKKCKFISNEQSSNSHTINSHGNISSSEQNTDTKTDQITYNLNNNEYNPNETTLSPPPQVQNQQNILNEDGFQIDQSRDDNLDEILDQQSRPTKRIQLENQQYSSQQTSQQQTQQNGNSSSPQKKKPRKPRKTKKQINQENQEQEQQKQQQNQNFQEQNPKNQGEITQTPPQKRQYNRKSKKQNDKQTPIQQQQSSSNFLYNDLNEQQNNANNNYLNTSNNNEIPFLNMNTTPQQCNTQGNNYDPFTMTSNPNLIKEEFNDEDEYPYKQNMNSNNNQIQGNNHQMFSDNGGQIQNNQDLFTGNNVYNCYDNYNDEFYYNNQGNNNEFGDILSQDCEQSIIQNNIQNQNNYQQYNNEVVNDVLDGIYSKKSETKYKKNGNQQNQINVKTEYEDLLVDDYNMEKSPTNQSKIAKQQQYNNNSFTNFNEQFNIKKEEDSNLLKINQGGNQIGNIQNKQKMNFPNTYEFDEINYIQDENQLQERINCKEEDEICLEDYEEKQQLQQHYQQQEIDQQQQPYQMQQQQQQQQSNIQNEKQQQINNKENGQEQQKQKTKKQKKQKLSKEQKDCQQIKNKEDKQNNQENSDNKQMNTSNISNNNQILQKDSFFNGFNSKIEENLYNEDGNYQEDEEQNNNQDDQEEGEGGEEDFEFEEEGNIDENSNNQQQVQYEFDITEDIKKEIEQALQQLPKKRQVKRVRNILINDHENKVHDYMLSNLKKCPQKIPDLIQCVLQYLKAAVSMKKYKKEELCQLISVIVHQYYISNVENPKVNIQTFAALRNYIKRVALSKLVVPKKSLDVKAKRWTTEEVGLLMQYLKDQVTYFEIARRLGRPYSGIVQQINKQRRKKQ